MFEHIRSQPFVASTALAAFFHSTWTLGTVFSGTIPDPTTEFIKWAGAIFPAALIAFSLDVGQVVTAHEVKEGDRSKWKLGAFIIFAIATYYLQLVYMIAHTPELTLGAGVAEWVQPVILFLRDISVFIIPGLLPLSTLLYTFSHRAIVDTPEEAIEKAIQVIDDERPKLEDGHKNLFTRYITQNEDGTWTAKSPTGRILRSNYQTEKRAQVALKAHLRQLKKKTQLEVPGIDDTHTQEQEEEASP